MIFSWCMAVEIYHQNNMIEELYFFREPEWGLGLVLKPTSLIVFYEPRISSKFQTVQTCLYIFESVWRSVERQWSSLYLSKLFFLGDVGNKTSQRREQQGSRSYMYLIKSKDNKEYIVHCTFSAVHVKSKHSACHWHWCMPAFVVFSAHLSQLHLRHNLRVLCFCVQFFSNEGGLQCSLALCLTFWLSDGAQTQTKMRASLSYRAFCKR